MMYNLHRTVFTKLAQWMTGGGIAVSANSKAPQGAIVRQNAAPVREMIRTLQGDSNLVMYPYGAHWKNVGEETFEESAALGPDGNFVDRNDPKWRDSLKDGFIRIAANAGALVVPVYVTFEEGQWKVSFGTPLAPEKKGDHIGVAKQYLEEMRQLKEGVSQS
jgi:1-acyl-sn-glycerol-3-phosphate acyltransferase